ncbi:MAG: Nif3-like dinuclear metal center hexameric protein [Peptostreptococcaceae bacterium]|nr:Nif3-like dinuclear metal center hexameric protein [Peptostreptococcaceae bacterium]
MNVKEITKLLDASLKKEIAMSWDNVGLLVGRENKEVSKIFLALELTQEVLDEAEEKECDMIIVHHPLIFSGLRSVIQNGHNLVYSLIQKDISLYATHTNFDMIPDGLNDHFAQQIGAENITTIPEENSSEALLRLFEIKKQPLKDFVSMLKKVFSLEVIRLIGESEKQIGKVGIVTGAGSDYIDIAFAQGADLFVTGDLKYHQAMDVIAKNRTVLDVGHFETEKIFSEAMEFYIKKHIPQLKDLSIERSQKERSPFQYI